MRVLQKGRPQKGWSAEFLCTGKGNGGGGCGAKLLVSKSDLYETESWSYGDSSPDRYNTFTCPECGVETDLDTYRFYDLPSKADWKKRNS